MISNERRASYYREMHDVVDRGWTKRKLHDDDHTRHCIMGAADRVAGRQDFELRQLIMTDLQILHPHVKCVENWNDVPWRRKRAVLTFLRKSAERYEELARQDREEKLKRRNEQLMREIDRLRARIEELEIENAALREENKFWKARRARVTAKELVQSNTVLEQLDAELDQVARELENIEVR